MTGWVTWVEFNGLLKLCFRAAPIPVMSMLDKSEHRVRGRQRCIELHCLHRISSCLCSCFVGRQLHHHSISQHRVRLSQPCVTLAPSWLALNGFLKISEAAAQAFDRSSSPQILPL